MLGHQLNLHYLSLEYLCVNFFAYIKNTTNMKLLIIKEKLCICSFKFDHFHGLVIIFLIVTFGLHWLSF